ncbi:trans-acting enoyl reductase family protein [Conexibacter sp. SYSU D00693]|uniref:saccharopine dehydrogenase family protein n=1 Tax=Conexibacter sp. SYSU D00693 TaxID=2812560 RepID=UPI00196A4D5F|nr:saccharopine dehydrogenase NADP-binding domain-containing protein [Conexibacter sp. SYSU D00693]
MIASQGPIAVYGATGFTGKLVAAELARRGVPAVLCGRSAANLEPLAAQHGFEARAAANTDPAALRAAFEGCAAVISCAGPFLEVGEPVVEAAIDAGCHYVDTTGETPFIQLVLERHGPRAEAQGVTLVPGIGFDYLPGDLIAHLAAEGQERLDELVVAYAVEAFRATRGTTRSALLMLGEGDWRQPLGLTFDFDAPIGRRRMSRYPSGEAVTVPRHTSARTVTTLLTSATVAPHPALERATPLLSAPMALAFRSKRLRALLDKAIDRLPEGPSEESRASVRWTVTAEARPAGRRATVSGPDVYGVTGTITVEAATRLARGEAKKAGGAAPSEAFDPRSFLDALAPAGVTYRAP